jgi:uncharacterized protein (TIGR02453 family)
MASIEQSTLDFLSLLKENNDRDWFQENKHLYETAHQNMLDFADELLGNMQQIDKIETPSAKKSLMRIYRDVRFSKDKSPYKKNFGGGFKRAETHRRGGYYFHIEPGNCLIATGFWGPSTDDLKLIRKGIANQHNDFKKIITEKSFSNIWGEMEGDQLKTAPKGYEKDHSAIELLRFKQLTFVRRFTDEEVQDKNFIPTVLESYKAIHPFFDFMSSVLTTDLNAL